MAATIELRGNRNVNSVEFNTADDVSIVNGTGSRTLNLGGGTQTAKSGSVVSAGGGTHGIDNWRLDLQADSTFDVSGSGSLTISALIRDDGGTRSVEKIGDGLLIYSGTNANLHTGSTTITAGTLELDKSAGTTAIVGNLFIGDGTGTDTLLLSAANQINDTSNLTFNNGVFEMAGGIGSETVGSLSGPGEIRLNFNNMLVTNTAANTEFSGDILGGFSAFIKQGTGDLTLSGDNTYTGITTISGGTLIAASDTALGTATFGNTIANGATLGLEGGITVTETSFTVQGTGDGGTGAIRNLSGNNTLAATLNLGGATTITSSSGTLTTGTVNVSSNLTVAGSGNTTIDGQMFGSDGVTKNGAGTLTFAGGTNGNSYSGATNVNDGTLVLSKTAGTTAIGNSSTLSIGDGIGSTSSATVRLAASNQIADSTPAIAIASDGRLDLNNFDESFNQLSGSGNITLGSGTLNLGVNSGSSTYSGVVSGSGDFTKSGSGTVTLAGSNTYTGATTINGGVLQLDGAGQLSDSTAVTVASGSTFDLNDVSDTVGSIAGAGSITLGSGNLTAGGNNTSTELSGTLSGAGNLTKTGTGTLTFSGSNTGFTGAIEVAGGGTLGVTSQEGLGSLSASANLTLNDGTLQVSGGNTVDVDDNTRNLVLDAGGGTIDTQTSSDTLIWDNGISGSGELTKTGDGTFRIADPTTFTGDFNVNAGTVEFDGGDNRLADSVDVTIASGATLDVRDHSDDWGSLAGSGTLTSSNSATEVVGFGLNNTDTEFSGTITADLNIEKLGSGNMTLSGSNSFTGSTTVVAGTLTLSADDALGSGSTTIASGATLALTGGITVDQTSTTLAGTGVGGDGAIRNLTGDNRLTGDFSLSGATTLQSDAGTLNLGSTSLDGDGYYVDVLTNNGHTLTVTGAGDTNLFSGLSGTGNLVKNDAGILTVTGVIDERFEDRFTGEVIINDGELIQATFNNDAPGVGPLDDFGINNDITIGDGTGAASSATLTIGTNEAGGTFDFANVIGENVNLTVNADGTLQTQGHVQYVQAVTLDGGSISTEYNSGANEGTLFITGGITSTSTTQVATIDGEISLNNDPAKTIDVATGSTLDIEARIVDGGFEKTGDGTLVLSGANTFVGAVDIANGIGRVESNLGLGGTSGVGTTNVDSGAQLQLAGVAIAHEALTLNGVGISSDGALQTATSSGTNSWGGSVTIASASEIQTNTGSTLAISGNIIGSGQTLTVDSIGETTFSGTNTLNTLNKTGAGNLTVTTGTNTISTVNVNAGTFTLGTSNILADSLDLNVAGGTFSMASGITETINQLNVSGTGDLNVDGVLTMNGGTLSGGDGAGSTGTLRLTAGNTLNITNDFDFGGTLELTAGTTLALSGGHTFNLENLNVTGNTVIDFGSADANTLNLGSLTIGAGVTITVNNWASFQDLWTTGSFSGGTGAVTIDQRDGNTAQITFTGFSPADTIWLTSDFGSNEITVPEPSSYGAILMGFGLIAWTLRRPRRVRHA